MKLIILGLVFATAGIVYGANYVKEQDGSITRKVVIDSTEIEKTKSDLKLSIERNTALIQALQDRIVSVQMQIDSDTTELQALTDAAQ